MPDNDCIFCAIASGATPAEVIFDGGDTLFFHDISPKAKIHVVGIPKVHITSLATLAEADQAIIGKLLHDVSTVARQLDLHESGYRVITNIGADAGQQVQHLHFHILGGEPLGPLKC